MLKRVLRVAIGLVVAAYLGAAAYMTAFQRGFLYRTAPEWQEPSAHGLPQASRQALTTPDGIALSGWWIAPKRDDAPVFLYFHGNANGLSRRAGRFGWISADGSGVLAMSYRGYGGSGGAPTEMALHADALLAYQHLVKQFGPERIVIFGESLGTGVALLLARQVKAKAVVLDSPYLSIVEQARLSYPWLPVSRLLIDQFRSDLAIKNVDEPILILHGTADTLIPPLQSEKLAALGDPARVTRKLYEGQPHVVRYNQGPDADVRAWLSGLK
jgi:fermentation-respiration switch protein FrsA (DUF1100 family)